MARELVRVNEINDWVHVFHFRFWMGYEEIQDRPPEIRMFDLPPQPTDCDFAGQLFAASKSPDLAIAQGLSHNTQLNTNRCLQPLHDDSSFLSQAMAGTFPM